jgi:hypothetical protein
VWTSFYDAFADFGIGQGIYFTQLLALAFVSFISGCVLITGAFEFSQPSYGVQSDSGSLFYLTAACLPSNVTAIAGCDHGMGNCTVNYSPNCAIPRNVIIADLAMSLLFAFAIFATKLLENSIVEKLDESLQTISDYSLEVKDPPFDSDNPDDWYEFFSRFGSVRYISILRKNDEIISKLLKKHKLLHRIEFFQGKLDTHEQHPDMISVNNNTSASHLHQHQHLVKTLQKLNLQLTKLNTELTQLFLKSYPVCRVYVTYEYEEQQRLALSQLEVPDLYAKLDIKDFSNSKTLFRHKDVLNIVEPYEPDNILWENLSYGSKSSKFLRVTFSYILFLLCLVTVWYVIDGAKELKSSFQLGIVVAVYDMALPQVFEIFTDLVLPSSESVKESTLQLGLFFARLMLSTLFPYFQTGWNKVLSPTFIQQVVTIQISACFITPLVAGLDLGNVFRRQVLIRFQVETQEEYNLKYSGSEWSLAEKYTAIAKVLFVSLYYAILVPFSLLLASCAFLLMFFVDRYLLLRKWRVAPMSDESMALRLRQQAILAVAAHMYVTLRFIYSWPMDSAYYNPVIQGFEKISKEPPWNIFKLVQPHPWQTPVQKHYLVIYFVGMILVFLLALYVWVIVPWGSKLYSLFFSNVKVVGQSQGIPFSSVEHNIVIYEPVYPYKETKFLCSYLMNHVPKDHRPSFITVTEQGNHDISYYVPELHRQHVLSIVKYYSKVDEEEYHRSRRLLGLEDEFNNEIDFEGAHPSQKRLLNSNKNDDLDMIELNSVNTPEKKTNRRKDSSYTTLPLHVQLDHQLNPSEHRDKVKGILPQELREKIASKPVHRQNNKADDDRPAAIIRRSNSSNLRRPPVSSSNSGSKFSRARTVQPLEAGNRVEMRRFTSVRAGYESEDDEEEEEDEYEEEKSEYKFNQSNPMKSNNRNSSSIAPPTQSVSPPKENFRKNNNKKYFYPT